MTQDAPLRIVCAGECMVELQRTASGTAQDPNETGIHYRSGFAGDVANFSIYLKRLLNDAKVSFLSATGNDAVSDEMRDFLHSESIDLELLASSPKKTVGLYRIDTDTHGERSFTYWRSDSAARDMFTLNAAQLLSSSLDTADYFYFTGITLAILNMDERQKLFDFAGACRQRGKRVVFDPNYRAHLWTSSDEARAAMQRAYSISSMLLASNDDEQALWGSGNIEATLERLGAFNIDEIVLTDGEHMINAVHRGAHITVKPTTASSVVDTTSAGDAFNAGYVAARHAGFTCEAAIRRASRLAAAVIAHPGAIIPKASMALDYSPAL